MAKFLNWSVLFNTKTSPLPNYHFITKNFKKILKIYKIKARKNLLKLNRKTNS
jgi:hypothetical protein